MTDKRFQKAINRTLKLKDDYLSALAVAEAEYERRYGTNPSDIDDDQWIDSLHASCNSCPPLAVSDLTGDRVDIANIGLSNPEKL